LYAISKDGLIPASFQKVHQRTRAPVINTVLVCLLVIVAGLVDAHFCGIWSAWERWWLSSSFPHPFL
jgi:amino acid transporter